MEDRGEGNKEKRWGEEEEEEEGRGKRKGRAVKEKKEKRKSKKGEGEGFIHKRIQHELKRCCILYPPLGDSQHTLPYQYKS